MKISRIASNARIYLYSALMAGVIFSAAGLHYLSKNNPFEVVQAANETVNCTGTAGAPTAVDEASLAADDVTFTDAGGDGYCELDAALNAASVFVETGVVLTHPAEDVDGVTITTTGDLTIDDGAIIDLDAKGCDGQRGPTSIGGACVADGLGAGGFFGFNVGGGGYGGDGAGNTVAARGDLFDSPTAPVSLGAGGGGSGTGGKGGGFLRLDVAGTLTLNGDITADGDQGSALSGGSGGGVYITADTLQNTAGTPTITANGGPGNTGDRGGGGGGRIAVYFQNATLSQLDTVVDGTQAIKGNPASSLVASEDGTVIFVYDPSDNSTPMNDGFTSVSDDTIRIKNGFQFDQSSAGALTIAPNVLEISDGNNFVTTNNVTALTLTFGTTADGMAGQSFQNAILNCDAASNLIIDASSSGTPTDTLTRVSGNTINCPQIKYDFSGYNTVTINDTITPTGSGAGLIEIDSDSGSADAVSLSGVDFNAPNTGHDDDQTIKINTTGNLTIDTSSVIEGNINESGLTGFSIANGSTWNGNLILTGLSSTSSINGTIDADGLGCQGGTSSTGGNAPGYGVSAEGGGCVVSGLGYGRTYSGNAGGGGLGGEGAGGTEDARGDDFGTSTNPQSFGAGGGGLGAARGGDGGGLVKIINTGETQIDGVISVDGTQGASNTGGSGGSIYVESGTLSTTGTPSITANGGQGSGDRGEGGGGMIAFYYQTGDVADFATIFDNTTAAKGSPSAASLNDAHDGSVVFVKDTAGNSSPPTFGGTQYINVGDDDMKIKNGFRFDRATSGNVLINNYNTLQITGASNVRTTSNVTNLTLTLGETDVSGWITEGVSDSSIICSSSTALTYIQTATGGDTAARLSNNSINCDDVYLSFDGFATTTLDGTIGYDATRVDDVFSTSPPTGASEITVIDNSNNIIEFDGAVYSADVGQAYGSTTLDVNTTAGVLVNNASVLKGNIQSSNITELDILDTSQWIGNVILTNLDGTSTIAGTINADGLGCVGTTAAEGYGVDIIGGSCISNGLGRGKTTFGDVGGGGYGGEGGGLVADSIGDEFGEKNNPNSFGASSGGAGAAGGAGGGIIRLISNLDTGIIEVTGTIQSNGVENRAGGSGGAIYLRAAQINGDGDLIAAGGNESSGDAAAGGGGRVAGAYAVSSTFSGTVTAPGGSGPRPGSAGTAGTGFIYYITNVPTSFTSSISDGIFDDSEITLFDGNGDPRAVVVADFVTNAADIDLNPLFISATTTKTLVDYQGTITGVETPFDMYIPYNSGTGVYICPNSTSITQVVEGVCAGEVTFASNEIEFYDVNPAVTKNVGSAVDVYVQVVDSNDVLVTQGSAGAGDFYKVIGLTGTGGGEQSAGDGTPVGEGGGGLGTNYQWGTQEITGGDLILYDVPDNFSFPVVEVGAAAETFNNGSGTDSADSLIVFDQSNVDTGFVLQLQANDFVGPGGATISRDNFYVATTPSASAGAQLNGVTHTAPAQGAAVAPLDVDEVSAETLLGTTSTFTTYGAPLTNPATLISTTDPTGSTGFEVNVSFYLSIPEFQAPGVYSGQLVYTLIPN